MSNPFLWKDLPESVLYKQFVFLVDLRTLFQCTENQSVLGASDAPAQLLSSRDSRAEATRGQVFPAELDREVISPGNRFGLDWEVQRLEGIICNPR